MNHIFNVDVAKKYGVLEAIMLNNFAFWIAKNQANERHYHDGKYWTYNSTKAFSELYPYATPKQIRNALEHLRQAGLIETGNFNDLKFDRTLWYTLTPEGISICLDRQSHLPCGANADAPEGKPIPDINTDIKPDVNTDTKKLMGQKRFLPPSAEEVGAYCVERKNNIDPQEFVDYYEAKGWMIGKNKMKDWKAAVRTWENKRKKDKAIGKNGIAYDPGAGDDLNEVF